MKGTPMKNILTAIVASTILISPAFAQNNQGGATTTTKGAVITQPQARSSAPAFRFLRLALAFTG